MYPDIVLEAEKTALPCHAIPSPSSPQSQLPDPAARRLVSRSIVSESSTFFLAIPHGRDEARDRTYCLGVPLLRAGGIKRQVAGEALLVFGREGLVSLDGATCSGLCRSRMLVVLWGFRQLLLLPLTNCPCWNWEWRGFEKAYSLLRTQGATPLSQTSQTTLAYAVGTWGFSDRASKARGHRTDEDRVCGRGDDVGYGGYYEGK